MTINNIQILLGGYRFEDNWLQHTNNPMELGEASFRYTEEKFGFYDQFLWSGAGAPILNQATGFPDVGEKTMTACQLTTI